MNKHMHSIQMKVEAEDMVLVEAVVEADSITRNRINKIRATQKIQVVAEEEEIKEAEGSPRGRGGWKQRQGNIFDAC